MQTTNRSPNFLENVSFSRNWAIKLLIAGRNATCSICLGCLAQLRLKNHFIPPLGKLKSKRRSTNPLDLASGNLGGAVIAAATASYEMQQLHVRSSSAPYRSILQLSLRPSKSGLFQSVSSMYSSSSACITTITSMFTTLHSLLPPYSTCFTR